MLSLPEAPRRRTEESDTRRLDPKGDDRLLVWCFAASLLINLGFGLWMNLADVNGMQRPQPVIKPKQIQTYQKPVEKPVPQKPPEKIAAQKTSVAVHNPSRPHLPHAPAVKQNKQPERMARKERDPFVRGTENGPGPNFQNNNKTGPVGPLDEKQPFTDGSIEDKGTGPAADQGGSGKRAAAPVIDKKPGYSEVAEQEVQPLSDYPGVDVPADADVASLHPCIVTFTVDETGHVTNARVTGHSGNSDLDDSCLRSVEGMRFQPAIQDHYKQEQRMTHTFALPQ